MASKFIKGLIEKSTILQDDWLIMQPDAEESTAYKIKRSNVPTNLEDGSGTTANGNAVDLGGTLTEASTNLSRLEDGNFTFTILLRDTTAPYSIRQCLISSESNPFSGPMTYLQVLDRKTDENYEFRLGRGLIKMEFEDNATSKVERLEFNATSM
ncbi:unnamed protein product, partial [marine sediment metagenome]